MDVSAGFTIHDVVVSDFISLRSEWAPARKHTGVTMGFFWLSCSKKEGTWG